MQHDELAYLLDIAKSIQDALGYIEGMNLSSFMNDDKTQSAVIYKITIIG